MKEKSELDKENERIDILKRDLDEQDLVIKLLLMAGKVSQTDVDAATELSIKE